MPRLALATAIAHAGRDRDLEPLLEACAAAGLRVAARGWDDPSVDWAAFDGVLIRSPWDYCERRPEFLAWCDRVAARTRLLHPPSIIRWNTDKHYLADLAARGVPVVPTCFVDPAAEPLPALQDFLAGQPQAAQFVVKPAVGAGARDAQRFARGQTFAAANHLGQLLAAGRSAMLQPYLDAVDHAGETGLVYCFGQFSHAIGKPPQLGSADAAGREDVSAREPDPRELALATQVLDAAARHLGLDAPFAGAPFAYARVDLLRDDAGEPVLLELELTEPSLFLDQAPGSAARFAAALARWLQAPA